MMGDNFIAPFLIHDKSANGRVINLTTELNKVLSQHKYPDKISKILSELIIITTIFGSNLKSDGIITSQYQANQGKLNLLTAEYRSGGFIRAFADFSEEQKDFFDDYELSGIIVVTLDQEGKRYQGLVEVKNGNLADAFSEYFSKSEQIDTIFKLSVIKTSLLDEIYWKAAGIILKKMPDFPDNDQFEKFKQYISTISDEEFHNLKIEELLNRLFYEEGFYIYQKENLSFKCICSIEKMKSFIDSMDKIQQQEMALDGKISIKCQFCSNEYIKIVDF